MAVPRRVPDQAPKVQSLTITRGHPYLTDELAPDLAEDTRVLA
jgi:hypothetical protein